MEKNHYKIRITNTGDTYQIPIFLEEKIDIMGVMSSFDGEVEQVNQFSNFSYSGNNHTIIVYNTINTNILKELTNSKFHINWGDGNFSELGMPTIDTVTLPLSTHNYNLSLTGVTITISIDSPWKEEKISKFIKLPFQNNYDTEIFESYDLHSDISGVTPNPANIYFIAMGKSRLNEFKSYGSGNTYSIPTITGITDNRIYTGYTIDGLNYFDYSDGLTCITGSSSGTTLFPYINDATYNGMISRNEFLIGFIDEPQIYSDIFIERGKQSLMERNLRLGEIDNIGELEIYGGRFFNIKKQ